VLLSGVALECKGKMPDRPADSNAVEAEAYLSSGVDGGAIDLAQILEQLPAVTPEAAARVWRASGTAHPGPPRPSSHLDPLPIAVSLSVHCEGRLDAPWCSSRRKSTKALSAGRI